MQSYIVAAKRTPFGSFGGKLKDIKASELGGFASRAAFADLPNEVREAVDHVYYGGVCQSDNSTPYLARHVGHLAGLKYTVPALTINRLCGSGFQAVISASQAIRLRESDVVLTGGTENMSMSPHTVHNHRWGLKYGQELKLVDSLAASLEDQNTGRGDPTPMGITAENLAAKYNISREDCDKYALLTQTRHKAAVDANAFKDEIAPVPVPTKKDPNAALSHDEHARPQTTLESLAKLPSAFKKGGVVTPGSASGLADGAASNIVVSEDAVKRFNLQPLARIVSWGITACEPEIMGIGPVAAIKQALSRANLSLADMDLIEVNEAFAAQFLAVRKELDLDMDKTNLLGGAIALGHPLGASGARITGSLVHQLRAKNKKYALGSACIGGGQGIAIILERC